MARTKGMLNLSGNLEVNAQAPLDARTIVPTEADLTVANNFPYPYVGLEVYVTGTGKKFRLVNLDTTQSSSWHEVGEGGGSGGGGHTIQDNGADMTARDNLNFVGMEVDDNDSDGSTDVAEHRLTSTEILEMMGGIPNPTPHYPVIFDERGTEYQVGWYILANGTKKPVYHKTFINVALDTDILTNVDTVVDFIPSSHGTGSDAAYHCVGNGFTADSSKLYKLTNGTLRYASWTLNESEMLKTADFITVLYTKTTDTPV